MPTILIVEDDRPLADVLAMLLADDGYTVRLAHDVAVALELLAREPVDIVLSDVHLPDVDGLTLLERLRATGSSVPVILMSAGHRHRIEAGLPMLVKPFDVDDLLAMIDGLIGPA